MIFQPLFSRQFFRFGVVALLIGLLGACAGPEKSKPADLGPNVALIGIRQAWASKIGPVLFPLQTQAVGNVFFVAGSDGVVAAIDARTGTDVWRTSLSATLSAGVGSDGRYASVVSRENELITLLDGAEVWRQRLGAVTLTAPLVAGERVFSVSADRTVSAFDAATGRKLWQQERSGEALVLGQSGVLVAVGDTLVVGLGGRLVGMNPQNGNVRWEAPVATSRGTNEVERLVDLVSGISREGDQICLRAFQSSVACVDASQGRLIWAKPAFGSTGVHGDAARVVGSESDGKVIAWSRTDGERLWVSERLRFRSLTAPLVLGRSLAVGDNTGILHFLSVQDGAPLNRMTTDGSSVVSTPVLIGQTVVAVTQNGGIFGFRPE